MRAATPWIAIALGFVLAILCQKASAPVEAPAEEPRAPAKPEGRIERTQPMVFSADETADVGIDLATPVVETIGSEAASQFTGRIPKVTIEVK